MTRGRKPLTPPPVADVIIDEAAKQQALTQVQAEGRAALVAASQHEAGVRALAAQVGYQLPGDAIDADLIQRDIVANMSRSVEAVLEVGRGLIVLKQACQHGQFLPRLAVLGLEVSVARRFMQAARKFANHANSHVLQATGNQSKLFELLLLDDDQLEELELTGQTGELKLDDLARMTVTELRAFGRNSRAEARAKDELLAEKNRLIDDLRAKNKREAARPADERLEELRQAAITAGSVAENNLSGSLAIAMQALEEHHRTHGGNSRQLLAGLVGQIKTRLLELIEEFALDDYVGDGTPEWMRATADDEALLVEGDQP